MAVSVRARLAVKRTSKPQLRRRQAKCEALPIPYVLSPSLQERVEDMANVSIQFRKGLEHDGKPSNIEQDGAEVCWIASDDAFGPHLQITGDGYRVCIAFDRAECSLLKKVRA